MGAEVGLGAGTAGSFPARLPVSVRTDELEAFRDVLSAVLTSASGEATFDHLDQAVSEFGVRGQAY